LDWWIWKDSFWADFKTRYKYIVKPWYQKISYLRCTCFYSSTHKLRTKCNLIDIGSIIYKKYCNRLKINSLKLQLGRIIFLVKGTKTRSKLWPKYIGWTIRQVTLINFKQILTTKTREQQKTIQLGKRLRDF